MTCVTGKLIWTFHTIPHPGEFGYDTWPEGAYKWAGGANTWGEISIDEKRGIAYFPLGSPTHDMYGGDRKGANLFGNSLLALDARTGKRLWHFQTVHHDIWDYDLTTAPKLLTVRHNGKPVDIVAQPTKFGLLYVFDRVTGQPLWPIEERPVPQERCAGRGVVADAAVPDARSPVRRLKFGLDDINPHLDEAERAAAAGHPSERAQRRRVHAADPDPRSDFHSGRAWRIELGRQRGGSGDRHACTSARRISPRFTNCVSRAGMAIPIQARRPSAAAPSTHSAASSATASRSRRASDRWIVRS